MRTVWNQPPEIQMIKQFLRLVKDEDQMRVDKTS
jgi:hypothetical protein